MVGCYVQLFPIPCTSVTNRGKKWEGDNNWKEESGQNLSFDKFAQKVFDTFAAWDAG